jgi:hypothetical protein
MSKRISDEDKRGIRKLRSDRVGISDAYKAFPYLTENMVEYYFYGTDERKKGKTKKKKPKPCPVVTPETIKTILVDGMRIAFDPGRRNGEMTTRPATAEELAKFDGIKPRRIPVGLLMQRYLESRVGA